MGHLICHYLYFQRGEGPGEGQPCKRYQSLSCADGPRRGQGEEHLITKGQRKGAGETAKGRIKRQGSERLALPIKANFTVFILLPWVGPVYFLSTVRKQTEGMYQGVFVMRCHTA